MKDKNGFLRKTKKSKKTKNEIFRVFFQFVRTEFIKHLASLKNVITIRIYGIQFCRA